MYYPFICKSKKMTDGGIFTLYFLRKVEFFGTFRRK